MGYMFTQIKELLTRYSEVGIIWFDGMGWRGVNDIKTNEVYAWIRSLQPGIVLNDRSYNVVNSDDLNRKRNSIKNNICINSVTLQILIPRRSNPHWNEKGSVLVFNFEEQDLEGAFDTLVLKINDSSILKS